MRFPSLASAVAVTGLGCGFERLLGDDRNNRPLDVNDLPTARVNIGFAF